MDTKQVVARVEQELAESCRVKQQFSPGLKTQVAELAGRMASTLRAGGTIYWLGNGGSAADAQHLAAELVWRLHRSRPALASVALTSDASILTAVANDSSYSEVFARQVEALLRPGDLLVAISTSGNSENVLRAAVCASQRGAFTVGWTGESGGKLAGVVQLCLRIPSPDTQRIQEALLTVGHIVCGIVEDLLSPLGEEKAAVPRTSKS